MKQKTVKTIKDGPTPERVCDKAILTTLAYRSIFNASLSFHQLATFLVSEEELDVETYKSRLDYLISTKKIVYNNKRYFLFGQNPLNSYERGNTSILHMKNAEHVFSALSRIKWIKMLAVTGSVAAHNAQEDDDIDVLIVTERNRLWLTRLFVVLYLKMMHMYRTDEDFSGKICPNIFVSEDSLHWPSEKQNVYVAHEILMMHPVVDKDNTYFKFIKDNSWVFDHFSNFKIHTPFKNHVAPKQRYKNILIDILESLLMRLQLRYMQKKKTTEVITKRVIHFNKMDHSPIILDKFHKTLSRR